MDLFSQIQGVQEEVQGGVQLDVLQLPLFLKQGPGGLSVGSPGPFNLGDLDSSLPICVFLPGGLNKSSLSKLSVDSFVFHIQNKTLLLSFRFISLFGEEEEWDLGLGLCLSYLVQGSVSSLFFSFLELKICSKKVKVNGSETGGVL